MTKLSHTIPEEHFRQFQEEAMDHYRHFREWPMAFCVLAADTDSDNLVYDANDCQHMLDVMGVEP